MVRLRNEMSRSLKRPRIEPFHNDLSDARPMDFVYTGCVPRLLRHARNLLTTHFIRRLNEEVIALYLNIRICFSVPLMKKGLRISFARMFGSGFSASVIM